MVQSSTMRRGDVQHVLEASRAPQAAARPMCASELLGNKMSIFGVPLENADLDGTGLVARIADGTGCMTYRHAAPMSRS